MLERAWKRGHAMDWRLTAVHTICTPCSLTLHFSIVTGSAYLSFRMYLKKKKRERKQTSYHNIICGESWVYRANAIIHMWSDRFTFQCLRIVWPSRFSFRWSNEKKNKWHPRGFSLAFSWELNRLFIVFPSPFCFRITPFGVQVCARQNSRECIRRIVHAERIIRKHK